jgi:hypothetical protein
MNKQNEGLAHEIGNHEFRPRLNQKSLDLAANMRSLCDRTLDIADEREMTLQRRRIERDEVCTLQINFM